MSWRNLLNKEAPSVTLPDENEKPYAIEPGKSGKPLVLFFYPKSGSYGCTREACQFRDAISEKDNFKSDKATIIGISADSVEKQKQFVEKQKLTYPILSDKEGQARKSYNVGRGMLGLTDARVTFVIDEKGVVRDALDTTINYGAHTKFVEGWLEKLEKEKKGQDVPAPKKDDLEATTAAEAPDAPVVQGGMQWVGLPPLAAAVSEAGGLGILTALSQPSPQALREAIRETKKLTSKPFGVNITLLPTINPPDYEGYARAAVEEGVKIFETAGNNPGPLIKFFKSQGCVVLHKCTTIRHAKSAERLGVDVLSIDGFECAGHPGEDDIGGLVLLARAAKELKIPYISSGGIADGRGLAASLALGACGANMGTRFMCTTESTIHENIKQKIVQSTERDTVHIFRTLHNTARVFKNKISMEVVSIEKRPGGAKFEDIQHLVSGQRGKMVYENGDPDYGIWSAGITVGLIDDIPTCKELLERMEREAEEILSKSAGLIVPKSKL
ncbi:hypothetical protein PQX77_006558 [Marasmius sp. AFHP31]|nr:hypothetical protein PQX77_006558 [Marasmius sp. AFHP31]